MGPAFLEGSHDLAGKSQETDRTVMRANTEGKAWGQGSLVGRLLTQRGDQAGLPGGESGGCTDQEKSSIREGDRLGA